MPLIAALVGVAFAAPMFALAATVEDSATTSPFLHRFVIIPMSLFAGVFYPVVLAAASAAAAAGLRLAAVARRRAVPGRHARRPRHLCWRSLGHAAYLLLWAVVGLWLALRQFRRRLSD